MTDERRLVFGGVAELYERARPTYPAQLVDDVIELSGIGESGCALEVGAGTGKATRLFAARGIPVRALEPSEPMAAIARRTSAQYGNVTVQQCEFEQFEGAGRRFELLFSAQAWHWISPELRYRKAREVLREGGVLAAFWNRPRWERTAMRAELVEAYRRAAPGFDAATVRDPMHPASHLRNEFGEHWEGEISAAGGFQRPEVRLYPWACTYSAHEYSDLLATHSSHIIRPDSERAAILQEVGAAIARGGGSIRLELVTVLCLARAA